MAEAPGEGALVLASEQKSAPSEAHQLEALELVASCGVDGEPASAAAASMSELLATRDRLTRLVEAYADTASELQRLAESREKRLSAIERLIGSFESSCATPGSEAHRLERLLYQIDNRASNAETEASRAKEDCERMRQSAVQQAENLQAELSRKERDVNSYAQRARDETDERCRLRKALTDTELELQRVRGAAGPSKANNQDMTDENGSNRSTDEQKRREYNESDESRIQLEQVETQLQCGKGEAVAAVKALQKRMEEAKGKKDEQTRERNKLESELKRERSKLEYTSSQKEAADRRAEAAEGELNRRMRVMMQRKERYQGQAMANGKERNSSDESSSEEESGAQEGRSGQHSTAEVGQEVARLAEEAAKGGGGKGPFGLVATGLETFLKEVHMVLEKGGIKYSYGWAIILLTLLVKAATFPLTKKQIESTNAMQALQPKIKELQQTYANDQQRLQLETSKLYQQAGVNPLAGILPTLATLPIWIGLYRALTNVAKEGLLSEGFFWIPSLAGPSTLADRDSGVGLKWLFPLQDGVPPIGWQNASAYLVLPVLLVASQIISQRLISPQSTQSQNRPANVILKVLPFVLGYFSLNVPSGLTLYWFTNNILSTAQSLYLKRTAPTPSVPSVDDTEKPAREYVEADVNRSKPSRSKQEVPANLKNDSDGSSSGFGGGSKSERGKKFKERKQKESSTQGQLPADPESNGNGTGSQAKEKKEADTSA